VWRPLVALVVALLLGLAGRVQGTEPFDFYVLALTWSPSFCAGAEVGESPLQCDSGRSYGFVLHGLWPQYDQGYPESCVEPAPTLSQPLLRSMLDIMPSAALVEHEWGKHGTCADLTAEEYFRLSREAYDAIAIPEIFRRTDGPLAVSAEAVERAFREANPSLPANGLSVVCRNGLMLEVRICLEKTLQGRGCPEVEARSCRSDRLTILPADAE